MQKDITYVAGIHGNEQLPVKALRDLGQDFIFGHPAAFQKNMRYIEEDLNAAFGSQRDTLESKRAAELLQQIPVDMTVVDFHTTMTKTRPFSIITDQQMLPLAKQIGVPDIVLMTYDLKRGGALINHRDGVVVELGNHTDQASYDLARQIINRLQSPEESPELSEIRIYEAYDVITEEGDYENFVLSSDGFVPVLYGKSSYNKDGIFGVKTRIIG